MNKIRVTRRCSEPVPHVADLVLVRRIDHVRRTQCQKTQTQKLIRIQQPSLRCSQVSLASISWQRSFRAAVTSPPSRCGTLAVSTYLPPTKPLLDPLQSSARPIKAGREIGCSTRKVRTSSPQTTTTFLSRSAPPLSDPASTLSRA